MPVNPYQGLADHHFWSRAVTWPAPGQLDPMIVSHAISPEARIVTMGSCFAQHLARNLAGLGLNHHVAEPAPAELSPGEAERRNFGAFSARFGNVYTVRQGLQLFARAFGQFIPKDDVWHYKDGFVDAFRPQIEEHPLPSAEAVRDNARHHLRRVREMFEDADWLVFTLGLTEGWRSLNDGAVYPVAPGVAGGSYDPDQYEFVNFSMQSVRRDLMQLIDAIHEVNPKCRIILTVSPVPLIATFDERHVLTATAYSKAVLRVAADEVEQIFQHVSYFPSYEIITSPAAGNSYFADDLRSINQMGVGHVMRVFRKHFVEAAGVVPSSGDLPEQPGSRHVVVCDEDAIERSIRMSGMSVS